MGEWFRWVGLGLVAALGLYLLAGSVGTAVLLNHLLTPGGVDWAGYNNANPPDDPFELGYRGDPKAALGLDFETVTYESELGPAEAWFVPAGGMSGPWAIYVHGVGGLRENGYRQLSILHEAGIPTLMMTYRNDRGAPSGKEALYGFGMKEWRDLEAAVGWAVEQGAPGVILVAESMGGAIAGQFLERSEYRDKVVALALDAPALDIVEVVADKLGARALPFARWLARVGLALFDAYRGTELGRAVSLDTVARFPGPLFLAHGSADALVPITISEQLVARRSAPTTTVWTGAEHLRSYKEDPERYRKEMLGWLRREVPGVSE